jgi:hypothetical protein
MSSLDSYLGGDIPSQKISWRVNVPEDAEGHHQLTLETESAAPSELTLAFGNRKAPAVNEIMSPAGPIYS